jgi:hypothetical protein
MKKKWYRYREREDWGPSLTRWHGVTLQMAAIVTHHHENLESHSNSAVWNICKSDKKMNLYYFNAKWRTVLRCYNCCQKRQVFCTINLAWWTIKLMVLLLHICPVFCFMANDVPQYSLFPCPPPHSREIGADGSLHPGSPASWKECPFLLLRGSAVSRKPQSSKMIAFCVCVYTETYTILI